MERTTLNVKGMSCPSCIRHIDAALKEVPGVAAVDVRLSEGRVEVDHQDAIDPETLAAAVHRAGYPTRVVR